MGFTVVGFTSDAVLPGGDETSVHRYVMGFPSGSLDADPFSVTVEPSATVWSGPAFAVGGLFATVVEVATTLNWRKLFWKGVR